MADFEESTRKTKSKSGKEKGAEKDSAKDSKDAVIIDDFEHVEGSKMNAFYYARIGLYLSFFV